MTKFENFPRVHVKGKEMNLLMCDKFQHPRQSASKTVAYVNAVLS